MKLVAIKANYEDCEDILALQKLAFLSEAAIYDDLTIPPLTQTLAELQADFSKKTILKIVQNDKIIASIRAGNKAGVVHIERVMVHPDFQKRGLGYVLMDGIEKAFDDVWAFKLFTGNKSFTNIDWYKKLGYSVVGEDVFVSPKLSITKMIKNTHKALKIKVCGMREAQNIKDLVQLSIDYIGFIFYEKSARYVQQIPDLGSDDGFKNIKKVGVFVNASIDFVIAKIKEFDLDIVQLHGNETTEYLYELEDYCLNASFLPYYYGTRGFYRVPDDYPKPKWVKIWKVFSVDENFDFQETVHYETYVDKFLFDTKTPQHGGSGQKFNWEILRKYTGMTPFFLSGGISATDIEAIKAIAHPQFYGLDVNSKFEISPALKDVPLLERFISEVRSA
jgi:phosphoribosylanthranilate isomerase